jgi:hypothetical protein
MIINSKVSLSKLNKMQDYIDNDKTVHHINYNSHTLTKEIHENEKFNKKKAIFSDSN